MVYWKKVFNYIPQDGNIDIVPKIIQIASSAFDYNNNKETLKYADIELKTKNYCYDENDENIIYNDYGYIKEYKLNAKRKEIEIINIADDNTCGNFIIGDLIKQVYPNVKTVLIDRYRGYNSNVIRCNDLDIDNFIAYSSQGADDPFEYIRRIPLVKNALFECDDLYRNQYYIDNNFNKKRSFTEQFSECLKQPKIYNKYYFLQCMQLKIIKFMMHLKDGHVEH
jgi:hypothetical protein